MLAIIGGSGLTQLANLDVTRREVVRTPYGEPSGPLTFGRLGGHELVFICLLYTSPSPRDYAASRMPSSA